MDIATYCRDPRWGHDDNSRLRERISVSLQVTRVSEKLRVEAIL